MSPPSGSHFKRAIQLRNQRDNAQNVSISWNWHNHQKIKRDNHRHWFIAVYFVEKPRSPRVVFCLVYFPFVVVAMNRVSTKMGWVTSGFVVKRRLWRGRGVACPIIGALIGSCVCFFQTKKTSIWLNEPVLRYISKSTASSFLAESFEWWILKTECSFGPDLN